MTIRVVRHCEERSNPEVLNINMLNKLVISRNEAIQYTALFSGLLRRLAMTEMQDDIGRNEAESRKK